MKVTLPDGTPLELSDGATGADAAAAIGPGLAKAALAVKVDDGPVQDLSMPLPDGANIAIVTERDADAPDLIRHDAAHLLAAAVMELYPGVEGTAFFKKKDLDEHLERLEQARARDHRRLGPQLGLFTFSEISPGAAFWLPKGTTLFNSLVALNRRMQLERGYVEVKTPQLY